MKRRDFVAGAAGGRPGRALFGGRPGGGGGGAGPGRAGARRPGRAGQPPSPVTVAATPSRTCVRRRRAPSRPPSRRRRITSDRRAPSRFDTLIASQLIAAGDQDRRHNLAEVVSHFLGTELDKTEQISDWSAAELSQSQVEYAAKDAAIMVDLREKIVITSGSLPLSPPRISKSALRSSRSLAISYRKSNVRPLTWTSCFLFVKTNL